jgi:hypothetical protein
MARVKTIWTVTGPVPDPNTGELIYGVTIMAGSVTGNRTALADTNIKADVQDMLSEMRKKGAKLSDYSFTLTTVVDDRVYYKMVGEEVV